MEVPDFLLAAFPPSRNALIDSARLETDDAMLMEIAKADYGQGVDELMPEIRAIRDTGIVPSPVSNMLFEVLTLTHYSNLDVPEAPPLEPGPAVLRAHQTRFFACALLLHIESGWPYEFCLTTGSALANGIISAKHLNEGMSAAVGCFLTWRLVGQKEVEESEGVLFALALLILATRLRSERFTESDLGAVATWALALESRSCNSYRTNAMPPSYDYAKYWLSPLSLDAVEAGFWRPLVEEFEQEVKSIEDVQVRSDLELCGLLLHPHT